MAFQIEQTLSAKVVGRTGEKQVDGSVILPKAGTLGRHTGARPVEKKDDRPVIFPKQSTRTCNRPVTSFDWPSAIRARPHVLSGGQGRYRSATAVSVALGLLRLRVPPEEKLGLRFKLNDPRSTRHVFRTCRTVVFREELRQRHACYGPFYWCGHVSRTCLDTCPVSRR